MNPFVILVDTRESTPYLFKKETLKVDNEIETKRIGMKTGDYSLEGFEIQICVERKSISDLFRSLGGKKGDRRERLEAEFQRMGKFEYSALVIEADWRTIYARPPSRSQIKPKNVLRTMMAWHMRYNVHIWPCPGRSFAEKATYLILDRFYRDKLKLEEEFEKL